MLHNTWEKNVDSNLGDYFGTLKKKLKALERLSVLFVAGFAHFGKAYFSVKSNNSKYKYSIWIVKRKLQLNLATKLIILIEQMSSSPRHFFYFLNCEQLPRHEPPPVFWLFSASNKLRPLYLSLLWAHVHLWLLLSLPTFSSLVFQWVVYTSCLPFFLFSTTCNLTSQLSVKIVSLEVPVTFHMTNLVAICQ